VAPSDAAQALVLELAQQLEHHPRITLMLVPETYVVNGEDQNQPYWLDRDEDAAADTLVRVKDYEGQRPEDAAQQIIGNLSLTP
jgi:hypothetical protein